MPALAQDPVVTRTGVHKVIAPPEVESAAGGVDPLCRLFTNLQWIILNPLLPPATGYAHAAPVSVYLTFPHRRHLFRSRWVLKKPSVVGPILAAPIVVYITSLRPRRITRWFLRRPS